MNGAPVVKGGRPMKRFLVVFTAFLVAAAAWASVSEWKKDSRYTIDEPYEFPVLTSEDYSKFNRNEERHSALSVPDEIVEQMTTRALLETYLDYPELISYGLHTFYSDGFNMMRHVHSFGLDELMEREDLYEMVYKRYRETEIYKGPVDKYPAREDRREKYKKQYEDAYDMAHLELLISQMDLEDGSWKKWRIERLIEKKTEERLENPDFYDGRPFVGMYEWVLFQDSHKIK